MLKLNYEYDSEIKCSLPNVREFNIDYPTVMLRGIEKDIVLINIKSALISMATYQLLCGDLKPVYEIARKHNFPEQLIDEYFKSIEQKVS